MRRQTAAVLGYTEETVRDIVSIDLIRKAMKSLAIPDRDWQVKVDPKPDHFNGRLYLSNKEQMRKALTGLQKLGFKISTPDYPHYNFIVQH